MTTAADLITEASSQLHGWGSTQDRITPLTSSIGPTDTTFTVDYAFGQAVGITPGVVQIDSELLYVTSVDANSGLVTVANGFGRGYSGTTAAAHTAGAGIISRPKFPRVNLFKQVNEVIGSLYPDLFAVKTFPGTVTTPSNTYTLPGDTPMHVIDAQWQDPVGNWHKCQSYAIDPYDGTFRLGDGMVGRPLRVMYGVQPTQFTAETDDLSITGLPASCADLLILGVVARSVPALDISRAQQTSVEQSDRSREVPPFAGVNAAKFYEAKFQQRLDNEARALRKQFRPRLVRTF